MTVDGHPSRVPTIPANPQPAEYVRLAREIAALELSELQPLRVAILASSTLEFLRPALLVESARGGVERALMAYLAERAIATGCDRLIGQYRPSAKNHIVERFLPGPAFAPLGESDDGTLWKLDLTVDTNLWSAHIRRLPVARGEREGVATT